MMTCVETNTVVLGLRKKYEAPATMQRYVIIKFTYVIFFSVAKKYFLSNGEDAIFVSAVVSEKSCSPSVHDLSFSTVVQLPKIRTAEN